MPDAVEPPCRLTVRINGRQVFREQCDPFHWTTVTLTWRERFAALFRRRFAVEVVLDADPDSMRAVRRFIKTMR